MQKIKKLVLTLLFAVSLAAVLPVVTYADTPAATAPPACPAGQAHPAGSTDCAPIMTPAKCQSQTGKVDPNDKTKCQEIGDACATGTESECLAKNPIIKDLKLIINVLGAGVGVVVTAMIILGGIQYSIAGDNSAQITAARKRIINAIVALVIFMLMYAFIQWLVPGGVFG